MRLTAYRTKKLRETDRHIVFPELILFISLF